MNATGKAMMTTALTLLSLVGLAAGQLQVDPFADVVRTSDLTAKPKLLEKRVPLSGTAGSTAPMGELRLEFVIERDGRVLHTRPLGDVGLYAGIIEPVSSSLRRWRFVPGAKDGVPVRTTTTMNVSYGIGGRRGSGGNAPAHGTWLAQGVDDDFGEGALHPGDAGPTWPRVKREVMPTYPSELLRRGPTGSVELEVVVLPTGRVGDVRVVASTDERFDAPAMDAARQWQFEPGMAAGKPAAVLVGLVLSFRSP